MDGKWLHIGVYSNMRRSQTLGHIGRSIGRAEEQDQMTGTRGKSLGQKDILRGPKGGKISKGVKNKGAGNFANLSKEDKQLKQLKFWDLGWQHGRFSLTNKQSSKSAGTAEH